MRREESLDLIQIRINNVYKKVVFEINKFYKS